MTTRYNEALYLKEGDVYRYLPLDRPGVGRYWCRDGYAIATERRGEWVLVDTYWGGSGDSHVVDTRFDEEIEFVFNLGDYDQVQHKAVWEQFHPDDRQSIPEHKGYHTRFYVKKGASTDLATRIANARAAIEDAESKVRTAQFRLDCEQRLLADLMSEEVPSDK